MVATHVVRSMPFQLGSLAATVAMAALSLGSLTNAVMAVGNCGLTFRGLQPGHAGEIRTVAVGELRAETQRFETRVSAAASR